MLLLITIKIYCSKCCLSCIADEFAPDILQWAPVNVISVSDCQDDWGSSMQEQHICIRDDNGEFGGCFVSDLFGIQFKI